MVRLFTARRWSRAAVLVLALLVGPGPTDASAQTGWSTEPTYRFAGHYVGDWTTEALELAAPPDPAQRGPLFSGQAGRLRGQLALEIGCDGELRVQARGQTEIRPSFAAVVEGADGPRFVQAALDLVAETSLVGRLTARRVEVRGTRVEAALDGTIVEPPTDEGAPASEPRFQRWYAAEPAAQWQVLGAEAGLLHGAWEGAADLAVPAATYQPAFQVRSRGRWTATRVAVELCPWRGRATVSGAYANEQRHEETVEFTFRPSGDGGLVGEGRGHATVSGGPAGGCQYSGGGAFAVRVVGEQLNGQFRLRLEDNDQPQLLVTTTCPGRRYVAPHLALATAFGAVELAEAPGAQAGLDAPLPGTPARGTLHLTIDLVGEAAPP